MNYGTLLLVEFEFWIEQRKTVTVFLYAPSPAEIRETVPTLKVGT